MDANFEELTLLSSLLLLQKPFPWLRHSISTRGSPVCLDVHTQQHRNTLFIDYIFPYNLCFIMALYTRCIMKESYSRTYGHWPPDCPSWHP